MLQISMNWPHRRPSVFDVKAQDRVKYLSGQDRRDVICDRNRRSVFSVAGQTAGSHHSPKRFHFDEVAGTIRECVRNSVVLRFIRRLIPYRAPDISPYERPLTDAELEQFGRAFSRMHVKAFTLPFVSAAMLVPAIRRDPGWWYRLDARLLEQCPYLHYYASIRVIELQK